MSLLRNEPLYLAVPAYHPYVAENPGSTVPASAFNRWFSQNAFLLSREGSPNRIVAEAFFASCGFHPLHIFKVNGLALTRNMVASNPSDVTFLPESGCGKDRLVHYYAPDPPIFRLNVLLSRPLKSYSPLKKHSINMSSDTLKKVSERCKCQADEGVDYTRSLCFPSGKQNHRQDIIFISHSAASATAAFPARFPLIIPAPSPPL